MVHKEIRRSWPRARSPVDGGSSRRKCYVHDVTKKLDKTLIMPTTSRRYEEEDINQKPVTKDESVIL